MDGFKPDDIKAPVLTKDECTNAINDLCQKNYVQVNRKFIDPIKQGDLRFALFSFIKAPGVEPDKDGVFGVAKIRGAFYTEEDAALKAEEIVKDVDSTNSIYTCRIGFPFPLVQRGFAENLQEIDLSKKTEETISQNVREKRRQEEREMKEIEERRQELYKDVDPNKETDPQEEYVTHRVKLAHLRYAICEHSSKIKECEILKENCKKFLKEQMELHPEYEEKYLDRYKQGRRAANIPEETDLTGFMKFMDSSLDD